MKDTILKGFVKNFANERGIIATDDRLPRVFEVFSTHSLLQKYHDFESSDPESEIIIGGGGDGGLDGVAILVNQRLVRSISDVKAFLDEGGRFNVEYVFVQTKLSSSFSAESIGHFIYGVESFFSSDLSTTSLNEELQVLKEVSDHLLEHTIHMYANPACYLYFVTTGHWHDPIEPARRLDDGKRRLTDLNLFSKVQIQAIDSDQLKSMYRDLKHSVVEDVEFPNCAAFPVIEGVEQAYIGLLAGDQYLRLITQADGSLNKNLFYNNIRDFQGSNPVNDEIHGTISSSENKINFPLLNNGVTIVARSIVRTANRFTVADYQIVNGCQTTHVLHLNRKFVDAGVFIPVKLVATSDSRVVGEIIKANNRQTEIKPEAWKSMTPFHKELEDFYLHRDLGDGRGRIYYERRSKQYAFDHIPVARIVTLPRQLQAFIGMFLNDPHSHHRYYGELLKAYDKQVFVEGHKLDPYYASGIALLAIERLIDETGLGIGQYKYHLLMLLRLQIGGKAMPRLDSGNIAQYCLPIIECVSKENALRHQFKLAMDRLQICKRKFVNHGRNPAYRLREFTNMLIQDRTPDRTPDS